MFWFLFLSLNYRFNIYNLNDLTLGSSSQRQRGGLQFSGGRLRTPHQFQSPRAGYEMLIYELGGVTLFL